MNSINQNQPEENHKDVMGEEAVNKIKELSAKAGTCFLCTSILTGKSFSTRPMAIQKTDDNGMLYFLSASDSNHIEDINADPMIQLLLQGSSYDDFLSLYGHATIQKDQDLIEELWNPMLKTWFTEGKNDPRIRVIIFKPTEGYYWDTKHGKLVAFIKRLAGAATGTTIDDSIEGNISL